MAASLRQHQRENIGVDDEIAKQQQFSAAHKKQQQSEQLAKQIFPAANQENQSNPTNQDNAAKEAPTKSALANEESDKKINITKMTAAVEAGAILTEISAPAAALAGAPSTAVVLPMPLRH